MQVLHYGEEMPYKFSKSIFLAGGSLRVGQEGESWRKTALEILKDKGFDGIIFVPENRDGRLDENHNYEGTVSWEEKYLNIADCTLFWMPRTEELPCYTSNVEWGSWQKSGKIVLGFPEDALKMHYIHHYAEKYNVPISRTLTDTIEDAMSQIGEGVERVNGERYIPLHIWKTKTFQNWYKAQTKAGNRLESANIEYTFGKKHNEIFLWAIHPSIYIAAKDRYKDNEIIVSRPDISSVCMWKKVDDDFEVVLVREFRSACSNETGYVWELPGGHTPSGKDTDKETAISEVREECDFDMDENRVKYVGSRQLAATLSAHKSHLFSYEMEDGELEWMKAQKDIVKGLVNEGERCYIEVVMLSDIVKNNLLDWTNIGQIYAAVGK